MDFVYDHMPVGSIVMWTPESGELLKLTYPNKAESEILYSKTYRVTEKHKTDSGQVQTSSLSVTVKLPYGWVPCFGQVENLANGATFQTPDMFDKYLKCYAGGTTDTGFTHHTIKEQELPKHTHKLPATINGNIRTFPSHSHTFDLSSALKVELRVNANRRVGNNSSGRRENRCVLGPVNAPNNADGTGEYRMNPNYARIVGNGAATVSTVTFVNEKVSFSDTGNNVTQQNTTINVPAPVTPFARTVIPIIKIRNVQ